MKTRLIIALVFVCSLAAASDAAARGRLGWRPRGRSSRPASYSSYTSASVQFSGDCQTVAEQKVAYAASRNIHGHIGGGFGGASSEGVGWGMTAQQALNNCCRFNSPIVAQATAQAANGTWFGIRLYR